MPLIKLHCSVAKFNYDMRYFKLDFKVLGPKSWVMPKIFKENTNDLRCTDHRPRLLSL